MNNSFDVSDTDRQMTLTNNLNRSFDDIAEERSKSLQKIFSEDNLSRPTNLDKKNTSLSPVFSQKVINNDFKLQNNN